MWYLTLNAEHRWADPITEYLGNFGQIPVGHTPHRAWVWFIILLVLAGLWSPRVLTTYLWARYDPHHRSFQTIWAKRGGNLYLKNVYFNRQRVRFLRVFLNHTFYLLKLSINVVLLFNFPSLPPPAATSFSNFTPLALFRPFLSFLYFLLKICRSFI